MQEQDKKPEAGKISRRDFIQNVAASGAGLMLSQMAFASAAAPAAPAATTGTLGQAPAFIKTLGDVINVGIIGVGAEGQALLEACTFEAAPIPKIRFKAVCDIWANYNRKRASGILRAKGHPNNQYEDYREMLEKEKDLHAVIVATPDWMHAEHSIACMDAGLHVYCEKEMSNSLEKARQMVQARDRTGKLLQIGHQRRSNPRYLYAINNVIFKNRILGRVGQANAQWNRSKTASQDLECSKSIEVPAATLAKYGYSTMHDFLNWRWYKKYGGGPIVDLGSHQIDIFSWVFKNNPKSVIASGGIDFYKNHEWYDTVMCIYEFETPEGPARAFYQVLTSTGNGGFSETFMGTDGTLVISELPASTKLLREGTLDAGAWDKFRNAHIIDKKPQPVVMVPVTASTVVHDVRESAPPEEWAMPVDLSKPAHQPHLENFFDAIRTGIPLNCPAEVGYETAVAVLAVNKAVETGQRVEFTAEDFKVS